MSQWDEIEKLPTTKMASDMGEEFTAKVIAMSKDVTKMGQPCLKLQLQNQRGEKFITAYRIPKARTGKGQMDKLLDNLHAMGLSLKDVEGKTFQWKIEKLSGSVTGYDRHYPVRVVGHNSTNVVGKQ